MRKILFLLLCTVSMSMYGQIPTTGQEQDFDYGVRNNVSPTDDNAPFFTMQNADNVLGKSTSSVWAKKVYVDNGLDLKKNATSTAVTSTVTLTNNGTTFTLSSFTGVIVNNSTVPATRTVVNFAGASNVTPLYQLTLLYVDSSGVLQQANGASADLTQLQKVDNIYLARVVYNGGFVIALNLNPTIEYAIDNRFSALGDKIRNINEGNNIGANGANLQVNKGAGTTWRLGSNFANDRKVPDETTDIAATPIPAGVNAIGYRNGSGGWTYEPFTGSITPTFWDDGTGVKATVANNKFTNVRDYFFNATNTHIFYLGRTEHSTLSAAVLEAEKPNAIVDPATSVASLIGTISVEKSCTALNNTALAAFTQGPRMQGGASSGGTSGTQNLQSTYLNSLQPQITTSTALGAVEIKTGSASNTDDVFKTSNIAGTKTLGVTGNGALTAGTVSITSLSKKTRTDINYVFEGDSRTATGAIPDYPAKLATLSNFAGTGTFYNVATGGNYIADIVSQYATEVYPKRPNGTTITEAYLFVLIGINDLTLPTPDFASLANTVKSYCATAKVDGFKVVLFTTFYRRGFTRTQELARQKYNDYLREGLMTGDYSLIDLENVFPPNQDSIFYIDAVHLAETGNTLIASYVNDKFPLGNERNSLSNRNIMQDIFTPYSDFKIDGDLKASSLAFSSPNLVYADTAGKLLVEHPFNAIGDTYIKNQNVSAQTGGFFLSGTGVIGNDLKIGSSFTGLNWPFEIHSTYNLSGWNSAFLSQNHTVDATYGGILLGHRENIGVIGEYSTRSIGIVPDGGNLLVGTTTNDGINTLQVDGYARATGFRIPSGTSSQRLMADGSVETTVYAPLDSPSLTGTPTAPTATVGTTGNQIATLDFANALVSDTAYDTTSWNGVAGIAPSKNAIRDKIESLASSINNPTGDISFNQDNGITQAANYFVGKGAAGLYWESTLIQYNGDQSANYAANTLVQKLYVDKNKLISYTVATLPGTPVQGEQYAVTDATAPTYLGTLTGGGSVYCPVVWNGTAWVSH